MSIKKVTFNPEAQKELIKGVDILADAVGSTLGPMGRNVVIETPYGATTVTKDGVTVASQVNLEDPIQNLGAQIVKQAASKTASVAGDGTTSSTVLAQALVRLGSALLSRYSPIEVKRTYSSLLKETLKKLEAASQPVTSGDILRIATVSANNDEELGKLIHQAYQHASSSGLIQVDDSKTGETYIREVDGVHIDRGYLSPYFINNHVKQTVELDNPLIFITDQKFRTTSDIVPAMEIAIRQNRPLLIIADEIDPASLQVLILNKLKGVLNSVIIKAPAFGERRDHLLKDLCALTSATLITESTSMRLDNTTLEQLGSAEKVVISKHETVLVSPKADKPKVEERIAQCKASMETLDEGSYTHDRTLERLARLEGKIAVIHVGAATETELKEKKDRVDDALRATRAASEKGYLPGGGTSLLKIVKNANPKSEIEAAFYEALTYPARIIASNAGKDYEEVLKKYMEDNLEYDALTDSYHKSLSKRGIIDPTLVTMEALKNGVSAANMILLSSTALTNVDRTPPYNPGSLEDLQ